MHSSFLGQTKYEMLTQELEQNYYKTIESIIKYGGFYIGRYETGGLSKNAVVRKMNTDIAGLNWHKMYRTCLTLKGTNNNVKTMMIYGSLWDETLEWLRESEATISDGTKLNYQLIGKDSTAWGNYYNSTFSYIAENSEKPIETETKEMNNAERIPTGSSEYTRTNNIYDMTGNTEAWTPENSYSGSRSQRGGEYRQKGDSSTAARHSGVYYAGGYLSGNEYTGCRVILLIE